MNMQDILSRIPDYESFLTLEEMDQNTLALAKDYPDAVKVTIAGHSQEGRPLYCLTIGNGPKNALIFGCPHPNEPIGAMMLEALTEILAKDAALREELGYTFSIIKAVDPDGVKRNEGWFRGPFTYYNYARHFYRPSSAQQVEWTFPLDYKTLHFDKPLPETQALMKIIREKKPEFLYSLHNGAFGGVFWYISGENKYLIEHLKEISAKHGIPLTLGEPEMPCCQVYANAVFEFPGMPLMYDYYEKMTGQDPANILTGGSCSVDYANQDGRKCFAIVCEMPYFRSNDSMDTTPVDFTRRDAVLKSIEKTEALYKDMAPLVDALLPFLPEGNAYRFALAERMAMSAASLGAQRNFALQNPEFEKPATKAQAFDNLVMMPFMHLLGVGMIAAAAEATLPSADVQGKDRLQSIIAKAEALLKSGCDDVEARVPCTPIPIKALVSVQMESGLMAALAVKDEKN